MGTFDITTQFAGDFDVSGVNTDYDFCRPVNSLCCFTGTRRERNGTRDQYDAGDCNKSVFVFDRDSANLDSASSGKVYFLRLCAGDL